MKAVWISILCIICVHYTHGQLGNSSIEFHSTDAELDSGFLWAKTQAMSYVHRDNDPVGFWYEAALPQRDAFCMRDVSHQIIGANMLGLADINKNILTKFVSSIAASRQWCGYWEIDKLNRPAPVDYKSDEDFWYNLPANFDIINACLRQFRWTGGSYVFDPGFVEFYKRSLNDYVSVWDNNHDGVMEGNTEIKPLYKGIGSYNEGLDGGVTGNDLIAAQYTGNISYAQLLNSRGNKVNTKLYDAHAQKLWSVFHKQWWNAKTGTYHQFLKKDGTWIDSDPMQLYLLRWDFIPRARALIVLKKLTAEPESMNVEMLSYLPLEAFRYGNGDMGTDALKQLTSPNLKRREYPEVSFGALEAYAVGLMGIQPRAERKTIRTISRLSSKTREAKLEHLPIFDGSISIEHTGQKKSTLTNHSTQAISWEACFYSGSELVRVNRETKKGILTTDFNGRKMVMIKIMVQGGEQTVISLL